MIKDTGTITQIIVMGKVGIIMYLNVNPSIEVRDRKINSQTVIISSIHEEYNISALDHLKILIEPIPVIIYQNTILVCKMKNNKAVIILEVELASGEVVAKLFIIAKKIGIAPIPPNRSRMTPKITSPFLRSLKLVGQMGSATIFDSPY
jgi:hypothetical protein